MFKGRDQTGTGRVEVAKTPKLTSEQLESRRQEHQRRVAGPAKVNAGGK